jgi:DNA polymerase III subunit epsilon
MSTASPSARTAVFAAIDFETTGAVSGWPVEPWQVGVVRVRNGQVQAEECFERLLHASPERPFNPHAPGRHARLRDALATAPTLAALWPEFSPWVMTGPLVAHGAGTERSLLRRAAPLHRPGPWVDTLRLVRHAYPHLPGKSLAEVVAALGLESRVAALAPGRQAHDALYDAYACAAVLEHCLALPGWENVTVRALVELR